MHLWFILLRNTLSNSHVALLVYTPTMPPTLVLTLCIMLSNSSTQFPKIRVFFQSVTSVRLTAPSYLIAALIIWRPPNSSGLFNTIGYMTILSLWETFVDRMLFTVHPFHHLRVVHVTKPLHESLTLRMSFRYLPPYKKPFARLRYVLIFITSMVSPYSIPYPEVSTIAPLLFP